jgi:hypothetical protein
MRTILKFSIAVDVRPLARMIALVLEGLDVESTIRANDNDLAVGDLVEPSGQVVMFRGVQQVLILPNVLRFRVTWVDRRFWSR